MSMDSIQTIPATGRTLRRLPWEKGGTPLMLAPLQGLTNRAMRALLIGWVRPDVVFTEFMRVSNVGRKHLSRNDLKEAGSTTGNVPLVVQLVGNNGTSLVVAARHAEDAGARHINLNLGCPYGRTASGASGGAMLQYPDVLAEMLPELRATISGTFSIKLRAGYKDPEQIFALLPLFEEAEVDFLIIHPRTVEQKYSGAADHSITKRLVAETRIPIIANGDIRNVTTGLHILEESGAAGLMLGRGAITDPTLFERLRSQNRAEPSAEDTAKMLHRYLTELLERYRELFCGERQILDKVKNVLSFIDNPDFAQQITKMKRVNKLADLSALIEGLH
jgi:tRNA-dihydrouridine synthase